MRIACVYLPSFPLQAYVRQAPHLAGSPLAVAESEAKGAVIVAVSRAAWAEGIRPGLAASSARTISPELGVVIPDPGLYRRALDAVIESLSACSNVIDMGPGADVLVPHRTFYLKVPARMRGTTFGQKILTQLTRQGFRGRVGVADDRFTAYVAAVRIEHRGRVSRLDDPKQKPALFHQSCTSVPRGGSAAFLAPLPLSYLPIDPDVQHLLETCGVKTLGDFAALPPPSLSRDRIAQDSDFQALARGDGPTALRGMSLDEVLTRRLSERMELAYEIGQIGEVQPIAFALRTACERISQRLELRDRAARELELALIGPAGETTKVTLRPPCPTVGAGELFDALSAELDHTGMHHPAIALELQVSAAVQPAQFHLDLFAEGALAIRQPQRSLWPVGMATRQAEAFRQAEAVTAARPVAHGRQGRRERRRTTASAGQQMLSFEQ